MRSAFVIVGFLALALPDDATLSRLLVGTWRGPRHETQYRADGTWILDPPDEGDSCGKWRIAHYAVSRVSRHSFKKLPAGNSESRQLLRVASEQAELKLRSMSPGINFLSLPFIHKTRFSEL
jgi:hypothetical protein